MIGSIGAGYSTHRNSRVDGVAHGHIIQSDNRMRL